MKREQLTAFGIPADKIKEFMAIYWEDVHKNAQHKAKANQSPEQETRQAIAAMVALIDDPQRLQRILHHITRQYYEHTQKQPQMGTEGVAECP